MRYTAGVDIGSTYTKAAILDALREAASQAQP